MAFDTRRTYLCYNNEDLIRDGFIRTFIEKNYDPVSTFNQSRLKNPPKGVNYIVGRDAAGNIVSVRERKKLLPASKIQVEIDFSKVMKNAVSHPIAPGTLSFSPLAGSIAGGFVYPLGMGGITSGFSEITFHLLESKTKVNQPVIVTQNIIDNKVIELDGYPLSIFGVVTEYTEQLGAWDDEDMQKKQADYKEEHPQARFRIDTLGKTLAYFGLDFANEQLEVLGKFSQGSSSEGGGKKRIDGATDSDGLFGGQANPELHIVDNPGDSGYKPEREVVLLGDQKLIFDKIIKDERKLKFRGDNFDANKPGEYPFDIRGKDNIDVTDKNIRIDTTDLKLGDTIYLTYSIADGDRYVRQNLEHKGTIAQGNTIGIAGWTGAIASEVDAFDYQIRKWKVPPFSSGITEYNIDSITDGYTKDDDYKLTMGEFLEADVAQRMSEGIDISEAASEIEGWRLSEAILWRKLEKFFAADYRGILYINGQEVTILYPRASIRDQKWFTSYLESLDFTTPTGPPNPDDPVDEDGFPKNTYLPTDLEKKIEENIDFEGLPGFLFDQSEITNSLLFDREKIHYYRPFADALKIVSKYNSDEEQSGIGIVSLDLLTILCPNISSKTTTSYVKEKLVTYKEYDFTKYSTCIYKNLNLNYYDLSYGIFESANSQPLKSHNCEEPVALTSNYYWSNNYDEQGIFLSKWYIQDSLFEWRPDGGSIESYWKIETPYFCGDFKRDTRVYIETMGGNSLDNFSWIYVDTDPFVPQNISSDTNFDSRSLMVGFKDETMHNCLCYHKIEDNNFESYTTLVKIDKTKTHETEPYNHYNDFVTGQNRLLGEIPSYSHGIPITDDIYRACSLGLNNFWFTKNLLKDSWNDGTSFDLYFSDDVPKANIPHYWSIRYIEVIFSYLSRVPLDIDMYISFYFEGSDSSISNYKVQNLSEVNGAYSFVVPFSYYHTGPLQFLGKFWKEVNIHQVNARFVRGNDEGIDPSLNIDKYKINSGQNAVVYDRQGRMMAFYANEETSNIDVAISDSDGFEWFVHRNLIRLTSSEVATLPYVIKDTDSLYVHLFYVLNDSFIMYKRINTDLFLDNDIFVLDIVPEKYAVGSYDMNLPDPERSYWGNHTVSGNNIRREPSYFVAGDANDQYFIDQMQIIEDITSFNLDLSREEAHKGMTYRFLFNGDTSQMADAYEGSPYSIYISEEGAIRVFLISNGKLSVKRTRNYFTWYSDIREQVIHKNYVDDNLNKGLSEEISNIQIVRNDYNKNLLPVLYFNNGMLFIRYFHTNTLFSWYDSGGVLHDEQMKQSLEIANADYTASPPKERTKNVPIFLVGTIPDGIKEILVSDIENDVYPASSELFIEFPYKDPDNPSDKDKNKEMVNRFNENFALDLDTQAYGITTARGIIRIFYRDSLGHINSIVLDSLNRPTLEVMNVFKDVK